MVLEKMDEAVISLSESRADLVDSLEQPVEAQNLRLAMKFVLHLCGKDVMNAVFESMCVNIENQHGPAFLTKEACHRWFSGSHRPGR
jgi:hypothetical protein